MLRLQEISDFLWRRSAFYQNILYYLATLITFDYALAPLEMVGQSALKKRLMASALFIKNSDIKSQFSHMMLRMLANGESYWYDWSSSSDRMSMGEIPSKYCQLAMIDYNNNLWRYYVNL